jgi:hypothetical protein
MKPGCGEKYGVLDAGNIRVPLIELVGTMVQSGSHVTAILPVLIIKKA